MAQDTLQKFSKRTVILHWIVGLSILTLMGVGVYMSKNKVYSLYDIHKSVGILIFAVIILRIIWRLKNGWPKPLNTQHAMELKLAKIVHWVLIIGTILFPLSGMMMSGAGGYGLPIFDFELLAANRVDGKTVPLNATVAGIGSQLHEVLLWIMGGAIFLHVAGALKHHFVYKDKTLARMLGQNVENV